MQLMQATQPHARSCLPCRPSAPWHRVWGRCCLPPYSEPLPGARASMARCPSSAAESPCYADALMFSHPCSVLFRTDSTLPKMPGVVWLMAAAMTAVAIGLTLSLPQPAAGAGGTDASHSHNSRSGQEGDVEAEQPVVVVTAAAAAAGERDGDGIREPLLSH